MKFEAIVTLGTHIVLATHCDSQEEALTTSGELLDEFLKDNPDCDHAVRGILIDTSNH